MDLNGRDRVVLNAMLAAVLAATVLLGLRVVLTGSLRYAFLGWNLLLAGLPLLFSLGLELGGRRGALLWGALWLLFFPNAPYMVTDLIHIPRTLHYPDFLEVFRIRDWFDLYLIVYFVLLGVWMGFESLVRVHREGERRFGRASAAVGVAAVSYLSGVGIYMGRFPRINSWDILRPEALGSALAEAFTPSGQLFALLTGGMILAVYLVFRVITHRWTEPEC